MNEPTENPAEEGQQPAQSGEFNIPAGLEPTPGVDTTTEGLAKKYGYPVPDGIKEVLDENGNAPQAKPKGKGKGNATGDTLPPVKPKRAGRATAPAAKTPAAANKKPKPGSK